jgi:hypothetical protein
MGGRAHTRTIANQGSPRTGLGGPVEQVPIGSTGGRGLRGSPLTNPCVRSLLFMKKAHGMQAPSLLKISSRSGLDRISEWEVRWRNVSLTR